MKDTIIVVTLAVLLSCLLGFGICATIDTACRQASEATTAYNNGICTECGGEYRFSGADRSQYYYTCAECDHTIRSNKLMK